MGDTFGTVGTMPGVIPLKGFGTSVGLSTRTMKRCQDVSQRPIIARNELLRVIRANNQTVWPFAIKNILGIVSYELDKLNLFTNRAGNCSSAKTYIYYYYLYVLCYITITSIYKNYIYIMHICITMFWPVI